MNLGRLLEFGGMVRPPRSCDVIRTSLCILGAALAGALHCSVAAADDLVDETAAAWLFREGRALMLEEKFDDACPMLVQSQKLEPHVGTLLNVAACHERQNRIASAWVEYRQALASAREEEQSERVSLAEMRIAALEPRVPWLHVFAPKSGVTVMLDGVPVASVGKEMPVDPGLHLVQAVKSDFADFEERIEVREGEHRAVVVRFVDAERRDGTVAKANHAEPARAESRPGRVILEAGLFAGYLLGKIESGGDPRPLRPSAIALTSLGDRTTCAAAACEGASIDRAHGGAGGVNLYAGYSATNAIDLGVRFIVAPEIGDGGGSVLAVGPSVGIHPTDWLTVGAWALVGNATMKGQADIVAPSGYSIVGSAGPAAARGSLEGGPGIGLELAIHLVRVGRHSLLATSTPLVIAGEGKAVLIPIGLSYRFR